MTDRFDIPADGTSRRSVLKLGAGVGLLAAAAAPATALVAAESEAPVLPSTSSRGGPGPSLFPGGHLGADSRFGGVLCSDLELPHINQPENVTELNVAWTREQFLWDALPNFDNNLLHTMATDQNYTTGLEVAGLIQWVPGYANGGQDKRVPPNGLGLPWYESANHWGWMAHHLAKSRIPAFYDSDGISRTENGLNPVLKWIIGNEPDICDPAHPGYSWSADAATYLTLLRTAWHSMRYAGMPALHDGVKHDVEIIFGSLGIVDDNCNVDGDPRSFWHNFLTAARQDPSAADNQFYFNHLSLNLHKEPERIGEFVKAYRKDLDAEGMPYKELWLTEMGVPVSTEPIDATENFNLVATPKERLHFLIQGYANALAAGVDRIAIYNMRSFLRDDDPAAYLILRLCMKYLKNTFGGWQQRQKFLAGVGAGLARKTVVTNAWGELGFGGQPSVDNYGPEMQTSRSLVRIDLPGPGFTTTVIYNLSPDPQFAHCRFAEDGWIGDSGIWKVGVEGDEQELTSAPQILGFSGATASLKAWGKNIVFIGGGTTMYRYPDGYKMITSLVW